VAAHYNVMGHSTVSCAKTAEPIEMPLWMKTRVGLRNHYKMGCRSPKESGVIFEGYPGQSKALTIFAVVTIQSPITSCSRRDHSTVFQLRDAKHVLDKTPRIVRK